MMMKKNYLMPDPAPNSIGNFFDNSTDAMSFIQVYTYIYYYYIYILAYIYNNIYILLYNII